MSRHQANSGDLLYSQQNYKVAEIEKIILLQLLLANHKWAIFNRHSQTQHQKLKAKIQQKGKSTLESKYSLSIKIVTRYDIGDKKCLSRSKPKS